MPAHAIASQVGSPGRGIEDAWADPRPGGRVDESRDDVAAEPQADRLRPGDDAPLVHGEADEGIGNRLARMHAGVSARRLNRPPETESVDHARPILAAVDNPVNSTATTR